MPQKLPWYFYLNLEKSSLIIPVYAKDFKHVFDH